MVSKALINVFQTQERLREADRSALVSDRERLQAENARLVAEGSSMRASDIIRDATQALSTAKGVADTIFSFKKELSSPEPRVASAPANAVSAAAYSQQGSVAATSAPSAPSDASNLELDTSEDIITFLQKLFFKIKLKADQELKEKGIELGKLAESGTANNKQFEIAIQGFKQFVSSLTQIQDLFTGMIDRLNQSRDRLVRG